MNEDVEYRGRIMKKIIRRIMGMISLRIEEENYT